jgi:hypothetical protein
MKQCGALHAKQLLVRVCVKKYIVNVAHPNPFAGFRAFHGNQI